jgi:hypothetical protein
MLIYRCSYSVFIRKTTCHVWYARHVMRTYVLLFLAHMCCSSSRTCAALPHAHVLLLLAHMCCSSSRTCAALPHAHVLLFLTHMCCSSSHTCAAPPRAHVLLFFTHMCCSSSRTCAALLHAHVLLFLTHMCCSSSRTCAPPMFCANEHICAGSCQQSALCFLWEFTRTNCFSFNHFKDIVFHR